MITLNYSDEQPLIHPARGRYDLESRYAYFEHAWNSRSVDYVELFETESGEPIEPGYSVTFWESGDNSARSRVAIPMCSVW